MGSQYAAALEIDCKISSSEEIPQKILKLVKEEILILVTNCIIKCISRKSFLGELKIAEVLPISNIMIPMTTDLLVYSHLP